MDEFQGNKIPDAWLEAWVAKWEPHRKPVHEGLPDDMPLWLQKQLEEQFNI